MRTDNSQCIAVLIHTPDHYDHSGSHLLGMQAMRVRHLKKVGFKVMEVEYAKIMRAQKVPGKLREVLATELQKTKSKDSNA